LELAVVSAGEEAVGVAGEQLFNPIAKQAIATAKNRYRKTERITDIEFTEWTLQNDFFQARQWISRQWIYNGL
jgi:hypothetical protein